MSNMEGAGQCLDKIRAALPAPEQGTPPSAADAAGRLEAGGRFGGRGRRRAARLGLVAGADFQRQEVVRRSPSLSRSIRSGRNQGVGDRDALNDGPVHSCHGPELSGVPPPAWRRACSPTKTA